MLVRGKACYPRLGFGDQGFADNGFKYNKQARLWHVVSKATIFEPLDPEEYALDCEIPGSYILRQE